ncbi:MAG: tRNA (adenosine(37)-N6)-dimethylallyltransferase MiaA [Candidatus Omnitrophica bacterium]|nr:tRNA (adenosine(37)-N6)-dimethylallyltransferase MiaA [Candidatus Omnitrophota bacterium]
MERVLFIVGPTASGKTEVSLALAAALDAEIISADSMQVYQGLDIGTAKVDHSRYLDIPHHMLDIISPAQEFSVYSFREQALKLIKQIHERGRMPIIVGGSGLYIKALTDGIADHPGCDESVRARFKQAIAADGLSSLHERLTAVDPETAAQINPNDQRRIIRALEIFELSGITPSAWRQKTVSLNTLGYDFLMLGIMRDRKELYARVEQRVDAMIAHGLLDEVRALDKATLSKTPRQAVGYKELIAHLNGEYSLDKAVELMKQNTRHLVKKQLTWFKKEKRIQWITVRDGDELGSVCDSLLKIVQQWIKDD